MTTTIKRGSDEIAYFLKDGNEDSWQHIVLKRLEYLECPKFNCYQFYRYDQRRTPVYRMIFDHFKNKHYGLEKEEHTRFQNFSYQILQELACFEAARHSRTVKALERKEIATHNLIKHIDIPLIDTTSLLGIGTVRVGELSYQGSKICQHCTREETC
jgi:hypothetical protein